MGGDTQYMWRQARSGQPAGRIWPAPTYIGGHPPYIGCIFINYYYYLLLLFIMGGIPLLWGYFSLCWVVFSPEHVPKFQGRVFSEKKRPLPGNRGLSSDGFSPKSTQIQDFPINMEKYPTQNDATDHIYPLGPPKPRFLFKNN